MRRDATSKEVGHVVEIVVRGQGLEVARDTVNVTGGHAQGRRAPVEVCVHDTITLGRPARHDVIPVPRRTLNTGSFGKGDTTRILGLSPRRTSDVTRSTRRACSWGAYARLGARSRGQRYPRGPCRPPPTRWPLGDRCHQRLELHVVGASQFSTDRTASSAPQYDHQPHPWFMGPPTGST